MKYIKLLILLFDLFGILKPIIIITEEYSREQTLEIFSRMYDVLSQITLLPYSKAEFLKLVNQNLTFILYFVGVTYDLFPDLFHMLTWKYVQFEQSLWLKVVDKLMVYAQESKEEITEKIKYYSKNYDADVAEQLIKRDLTSQLKKFDLNWIKTEKTEIERIKEQLNPHTEPNDPNMNDSIGWYDEDGYHTRKKK